MFWRKRKPSNFAAELDAHLELETGRLKEQGLSGEEARMAALRAFGNVTRAEERFYEEGRWMWWDHLMQDLRFGLRILRKNPGLTAVAVLTLALGIGATDVIFSVVDNTLLRPFPYRDADGISIFRIHDLDQATQSGRLQLSVPEFLDFREQNHVFADMTGTGPANVLYTGAGGTQELQGAAVTTNTFQFLGVPPVLGRWIATGDGAPDAPPVFMMNYRMWQEQFHGDRNILGTVFNLNGVPRTLVGIMPPRFQYFGADVWLPLGLSGSGAVVTGEPVADRRRMYLIPEERRKAGISPETVASDLNVIAQRISKLYPKDYPKHFNVKTDALASDVVGDFKGMLYVLLAAVAMLLLIACSNVANLLLARASSREKEIAVRASIGASHGRLLRQLLVESFVLAAAGSFLGCLFAYAGLKALMAVLPQGALPSEAVIEMNSPVLLFTVAVTMLTTLLCGLAPALHAVGGELHPRLKDAGRGVNSGSRPGRFRSGLVVGEVALSIVLLAGAGLMMRSFFAIEHVDLGFNPQHILAVRLAFPEGHYSTPEQNKLFFQQVLPRLSAVPGVVAAAVTVGLPPFGGPQSEVTVPGKTHSERWNALFEPCSEGWFRTMGIPLVRGRLLSETDVDSARQAAVINQALARRFFGQEDPIGQKIKFNALDQAPEAPHDAYFEIVGIVADTKKEDLQQPTMPEGFIPYTVASFGRRSLLVRTSGNPDPMLKSISRAVWAVDPDAALTRSGSIQTFLQDFVYAGPRFGLVVLGVFAAIGLLLVVIGVFSVMAYSVSLQTHEIGIRMALGARRSGVLGMVLARGLRLVALGIVIGEIANLGLTRLLASQIWGVSARDPLTFASMAMVIAIAGTLACVVPARKASRVDPMVALRYE
ncbi:MAG TPA: ABC transporter permease [Terriglobia bacterium]|nr:ABC transporter permease [Terriglobia bacterium]